MHALQLNMPTAQIATDYRECGARSTSKQNAWRHGLRILWRIILLLKYVRPLAMFGAIIIALAQRENTRLFYLAAKP